MNAEHPALVQDLFVRQGTDNGIGFLFIMVIAQEDQRMFQGITQFQQKS